MSQLSDSTLFLGDLSIFSNEQEIFNLFQPFGPIESIQKLDLSCGFIKFAYHQSAAEALQQINGQIFLGRAICVGWATDTVLKSPKIRMTESKEIKKTAKIHFTFNSGNPEHAVTEATLRQVFSKYGEVVDISINKTMFAKVKLFRPRYFFLLTHFFSLMAFLCFSPSLSSVARILVFS
jgi:RNA recognition motif-containing protein